MSDPSGKFVLRLPTELHGKLVKISKSKNLSLNTLCNRLIVSGLGVKSEDEDIPPECIEITKQLRKKFKDKLIGVMLFGSYIKGESTESSDIDILIVIDKNIPIVRSLYSWWDTTIKWSGEKVVSPHFVKYPKDPKDVSGIWLEVAGTNIILFEKGSKITKIVAALKNLISSGGVRRYISNGHPYWVWRKDEK